jgi:drug/metabolite transporter (DMT)-like permease
VDARRLHAGQALIEAHAPRGQLATALAIVYLVWGSSYIATKVMVTDQPPLVAAGFRFTLAGTLLGAFAAWRYGPPVLSRTEIRHVLLMAFLAVLFSNACHVIAMQFVQSNTAALLNATPALWIAWLGTIGPRRRPLGGAQQVGLVVGLAGMLMILAPKGGFEVAGLGWQLLILLGCLSWSVGTFYHRNAGAANPPLMFVALQMLAGGLGLLALAFVARESFAFEWTPRAFAAFLFLVFASSCLAYSAYAWLTVHATPVVVGSYGYVCPAIAALLGWLVLGEMLSWIQLTGMAVILGGIALVTGYWRPLPPRQPTGNEGRGRVHE